MIKIVPILLIFFFISEAYSQHVFPSHSMIRYELNAMQKEYMRNKKNPYYTKDEYVLIAEKEKESFLKEAKPSPESELSVYLKSKLTETDLDWTNYTVIKNLIKYQSNPLKYKPYDYTIVLSFEVTNKNEYKNIEVYTGNYYFDKVIKDIFKNYPIEKLNLNEKNKRGKNLIQLFSREKNKTVINASNFVVLDEEPTSELCSSISNYSKRSNCFKNDLYSHIFENISLEELSKQKKRGKLKIYPRFSVDSTGNIFNVKSIAPNKVIEEELNRVIKLYDKKLIPAKRNGIPKSDFYSTNYILNIGTN